MDSIATVPLVMTGVACYGQYHNSATRYDRSGVLWTVSQQCHLLWQEWRVMDSITTVPLVTGVACYGQYNNSATRCDRSGVLWTVSQQCHLLWQEWRVMDSITTVPLVTGVTCFGQYHNSAAKAMTMRYSPHQRTRIWRRSFLLSPSPCLVSSLARRALSQ